MSSFLSKCAALGLLGAGFTLTGDVGWLTRRGMRLLEATTVPSEMATPSPETPVTAPIGPPAAGESPGAAAADRIHVPPPPGTGPERIDLASLRAGDRLLVWFAAAGSASGRRCVTLDIVDPVSGEALLHRHQDDFDPGTPAFAAPPRRVTVSGPAGGGLFSPAADGRSVAIGGTIRCRPVGIAHDMAGPGGAESYGPILALAVRK
jgi:hypothetical protein